VGCGQTETVLFVSHWVASDPSVIGLEPSSAESAIVTALAPGVSRITAQRTLQDGNESVVGLSDPLRTDAACEPQAEFVFEVIP